MKVLIISGIPIRNDTNSGKTLQTLFAGFNSSELSQLYFSPQIPNVNMCSSYYQIYEKQMVQSFFGIVKSRCGVIVTPALNGEKTKKPEENALLLTKNKSAIHIRLAREIVWSLTKWKNNNFKSWLKRENPDVIFAVMHNTNGATKAVNWVAKETGCKIVLFVTDDYYHDPENSTNILRKSYYKKRKRLNQEMSTNISTLIGCSGKITDYFANTLKISGLVKTVYTPSAPNYLNLPYKEQNQDGIVKLRYFGNLGLGRWQILKTLGMTIKAINADGEKAILEIYSSDTDPETRKELTIENGCVYKGWVYGEEYFNLLQSADVAVHVESFDEKNIRRTWGTVSTKIADYLGAGKCILAIGSLQLASIDHIKDVACVVSDLGILKSSIEGLIADSSERAEMQDRARALAMKDHNIEEIKVQIRQLLEASIG
jgi:hypothetical protein